MKKRGDNWKGEGVRKKLKKGMKKRQLGNPRKDLTTKGKTFFEALKKSSKKG